MALAVEYVTDHILYSDLLLEKTFDWRDEGECSVYSVSIPTRAGPVPWCCPACTGTDWLRERGWRRVLCSTWCSTTTTAPPPTVIWTLVTSSWTRMDSFTGKPMDTKDTDKQPQDTTQWLEEPCSSLPQWRTTQWLGDWPMTSLTSSSGASLPDLTMAWCDKLD